MKKAFVKFMETFIFLLIFLSCIVVIFHLINMKLAEKHHTQIVSKTTSVFVINTIPKPKVDAAPIIPLNTYTLNFKTNQYKLTHKDIVALNNDLLYFKKYPALKLTVNGYASKTGPWDYNYSLSVKRAQSVASYLKDHGISLNRVTVRGNSYLDPITSNATALGRYKNQRVEIAAIK